MDDKILSYCKSVDEVWHAGDIGSIDVVDKINMVFIKKELWFDLK